MFDNIRVGVAGWSYPDWKGFVYPKKSPRNFHPLPFLAETFDIVEIDTSFYRIPDPITAGEWARKVSDFPKFRFTVKLFQGFTHTRKASLIEERAFHRAVEPLIKMDKFSALLIQLPWSFRNIPENKRVLEDLLKRFAQYPKAVELRHGSWVKIDTLAFLREHRATFCNIDQPVFAHSTGATAAASEELAYFRFHGRNAASWFKDGVGRDERYNYLYSPSELVSWAETAKDTSVVANEVAVIFNNHFKGQAAVNALEFSHAIKGKKVPVMEDLIPHYPQLENISSRPVQKTLFAGVASSSYNG
jgi:uncharacterized protein YecE (DUF72 family)